MQAQKWRTRPSDLLQIEDAYVAYCLDEAVLDLASWIEDELDKVKVKGNDEEKLRIRREARLKFLLTGEIEQQFADPMRR